MAVFARHAGIRTKATFNPRTHEIAITSGSLTGHSFASPTAAMRAVITQRNPAIRSSGNGWRFWTVTATGLKIHSLRDQ